MNFLNRPFVNGDKRIDYSLISKHKKVVIHTIKLQQTTNGGINHE